MAFKVRAWLGVPNWRALCTYAAIILSTLVGAELLVRIYDWAPRSRDVATGDNLGQSRYNHSNEGFGDLVPGQDGHWGIWYRRPFHVQTNRVGLRNGEEASGTAFRVLAIGDSQTFGIFLPNEDTWPAWTENYLRRRNRSAEDIQVFNGGIVGYTVLDQLEYLKDKGVAFKPQLVILGVFENDLSDLRKERRGVKKRPTNAFMSAVSGSYKTFMRNIALNNLVNNFRNRAQFEESGIDIRADRMRGGTGWSPPSPNDAARAARYTAAFREMAELLKSHGIALAVIFIPAVDSMDVLNASIMEPVIRAATEATGSPYLDFTAIFREQPDPVSRLYLVQKRPNRELYGDAHLSRDGNAIREIMANCLSSDWRPHNRVYATDGFPTPLGWNSPLPNSNVYQFAEKFAILILVCFNRRGPNGRNPSAARHCL